MPGWSVEVHAEEVLAKLAKASQEMKRMVAEELDSTGVEMEGQAREIVPVRTGYLRSTIYHQVSDLTLELGASADYAPFVEFGTSRMSAQPFIRPAFDAGQQKLFEALIHGVMNAFG